MTPDKERQAQSRRRRSAAGLVRLELWAHPEHVEAIRRYAARLAKVLTAIVKEKK